MKEADKSGKPSRLVQLLVFLVLILSFRYWLYQPCEYLNPVFIASVPLCIVILLVRPLNRRLDSELEWLGEVCAAHRAWAVLLVGAGVFADLMFEAWRSRGLLYLKWTDEHSYMIGARMLSHGRLWLAAYPADVRDFFDTFYLIVDRAYASIYFPGTAMAAVPGVLLGVPYWLTPLVSCTVVGVMLYLVVEELFDSVRGLVSVLMLLSLASFRWTSIMMMSNGVFLVAELLLFWAWLRWRRNHGRGWAALIGAAAGYGAITRPVDMLCFATAVGIAILFELRQKRRLLARTLGLIALGAAPFLAVQVVQNIGITGRWYQTAEGYYVARNYPGFVIGFHKFDSSQVPQLTCPPKQVCLRTWMIDLYRNHTFGNALAHWYPDRLDQLLNVTLGKHVPIIFFFVGLFSLSDIKRLALVGAMALFMGVFFAYVFELDQYLIVLIPGMICLVLMGWDSLERTWPTLRSGIRAAMVLMLTVLSISLLPEFNPGTDPELGIFQGEREIDHRLALLPQRPAVVLFRFNPNTYSFHADPVYNDSVAWPDDALIVRARDLGDERNWKLFRYYAQRQPDRTFYIYDLGAAPGADPLSPPLGTAHELAGKYTPKT